MRVVLPGEPRPRLQAVCAGFWAGKQINAYITGSAFVILESCHEIIQTIYEEDGPQLDAIAFDEATGKFSTSSSALVRIYKPYGVDEGDVKWSLQSSFTPIDGHDLSTVLSWGTSDEILVGSTALALCTTHSTPEVIWTTGLANSVKFASLSYDSFYIASTGEYDSLVKVWRRLSFGSDDVRFDFTYLYHPSTVTDLRWRQPYHRDQTIDNVLYTTCADHVLRIWAATDHHGLQIFQLWAQIDLQESIQARPSDLGQPSSIRYSFIIDGKDFSKATERAVEKSGTSDSVDFDSSAIEHLIEIANRSPEICVVLDNLGHMSAWGLESVGCQNRKMSNIFNVCHTFGLQLGFSSLEDSSQTQLRFYNYCEQASGDLVILAHHFDGRVELFRSNICEFLYPVHKTDRITPHFVWTGHNGSVEKLVRNTSGTTIVSRTASNETVVWRHTRKQGRMNLTRQSVIQPKTHVRRLCILEDGHFVLLLHELDLSLWDCRSSSAEMLTTHRFETSDKPVCVLILPEVSRQSSVVHVATISSKMKGVVWELCLPDSTTNGPTSKAFFRELCVFDLGQSEESAYILPVDPAGLAPVISGFLDTFARDVVMSYSSSGMLRFWTVKIDTEGKSVDWLLTGSVETCIENPALASGSSIRKAAIVNANRSQLNIWNVRGGELELSETYEARGSIRDLDWTSTPDGQSILAVGFQSQVLLLSQMRYDYLNKGPAWACIREISVREMTPHPIGDSTWLGSGSLVVGSGNQLFFYDRAFSMSKSLSIDLRQPNTHDSERDLFEVATRLNGPLPVYHPQFLSQCILVGKVALVQRIVVELHKCLNYHVDGDQVDHFLGIPLKDFYTPSEDCTPSAKKGLNLSYTDFDSNEDVDVMTEEMASATSEKLKSVTIPRLSAHEQIQLADIIECVAVVEKQRRSMDDNATRFMLSFRQQTLRKGRAHDLNLSWRDISWAFHSNSQDILVDMASRQFHSRLTWADARETGLCMWITDPNVLKSQFEAIARNEYTKSDMKNPIDCSLFYLALRKKAVLSGLWRMAGWNREQGATLRLLSNNFQEPKWKTVALKNAYALLGKHRFEYAAAFFLLADHLKDAVNVCLNQLKDVQLAIAVARVYEGDDGPVLRELLEDKVLPLASQEGNRWLASWVFWMLNRRDLAVRVLVAPIYTLDETPPSAGAQASSYLTHDPALVVLYVHLRQLTVQTLQGALRVTPKAEWEFVLNSARLYDRMGCDILALDLVRNWEFLLPAPSPAKLDSDVDVRKFLRRRSSLVVYDLPKPKDSLNNTRPKKPDRKVFVEPESNSLLDSFGF